MQTISIILFDIQNIDICDKMFKPKTNSRRIRNSHIIKEDHTTVIFDWMVYCTANNFIYNQMTESLVTNDWIKKGKPQHFQTYFPAFDWEYYVEHNGLDINDRLTALDHWFKTGKYNQYAYSPHHQFVIDCANPNFDQINQKIGCFVPNKIGCFVPNKIGCFVPNKIGCFVPNKIGCFVHLGNFDLWEEFKCYLKNMGSIEFDLWISIPLIFSDEDIKYYEKQISMEYPDAHILITPNKGFDIGGFLFCLKEMYRLDMSYDLILKLHTKSDKNWRKDMVDCLFGSNEIVRRNMRLFTSGEIGMIGSQSKLYTINGSSIMDSNWQNNKFYLMELCDKFYQEDFDQKIYKFFGGTIFWMRGDVLFNQLTSDNVDWLISRMNDQTTRDINWINLTQQTTYGNLLWKGCPKNLLRDGMFEHAVERFMGYIVMKSGYLIEGI